MFLNLSVGKGIKKKENTDWATEFKGFWAVDAKYLVLSLGYINVLHSALCHNPTTSAVFLNSNAIKFCHVKKHNTAPPPEKKENRGLIFIQPGNKGKHQQQTYSRANPTITW